jgi:hypothetical protein
MVKHYECLYCMYKTNRKSRYTDHLNSKKHCLNVIISNNNDILKTNDKISEREPMFSEREPMFSEREPMFSEREPAFAEQEPTLSGQEPTLSEQELTLSEQEPTLYEQNNEISGQENNIKKSNIICKYCNTKFNYNKNMNRHYSKCKLKDIYIENETIKYNETILKQELLDRDKKIYEKTKQIQQIDEEKTKQIQQLEEEKKKLLEIQSDYYSLLKEMNEYNRKPTKGAKTTINMVYIINNFKDAHNLSDLMEPEFTEDEKKMIDDNGPLCGTISILDNRCIKNMSIEKRPFHCVDTSRQKFIINKNNAWKVDLDGNEIMSLINPKIYDYCKEDISDKSDMSSLRKQKNLLESLQRVNQKKIIKELCDMTSINELKVSDINKILPAIL